MKLTKETLKRIIKEELDTVLSEEELEEGWKQNLALGLGLMGAGAGVANYNKDTTPTDEFAIQNPVGPEDTANAYQKSSRELQHSKDAAATAAKLGKWDDAERHLRDYHAAMARLKGQSAIQTGKGSVSGHGAGAVAKDLQQLKSIYGN